MARPRIFISSTFFDLRQVREDIERAIRDLGYEAVRHETGVIPYSRDLKLESAAYREVDLCDVLIAIVGGRYGAESRENPGSSITQNEIRRALERGVQVFLFIEKSVYSEHATYERNKNVSSVTYNYVDNPKVFEFVSELRALPQNNPIFPFETSLDIVAYLKEQFAGLFQRFLQDKRLAREEERIDQINATTKTLKELVEYLTAERRDQNGAIRAILMANHPAFVQLAKMTKTSYRVYFSTKEEFETWLVARGWNAVDELEHDVDSLYEYSNKKDNSYIKIVHRIFDDEERLKPYSEREWNPEWIQRAALPAAPPSDDDIPF